MPWAPGKIPEPRSEYQRSLGLKICLMFLKKNDGYDEARDYIDGLGRADSDVAFGLSLIEHLIPQEKRMVISAFEMYMAYRRDRPWYD